MKMEDIVAFLLKLRDGITPEFKEVLCSTLAEAQKQVKGGNILDDIAVFLVRLALGCPLL